MASFFFNCIRGYPASPSLDHEVADYCGCFDIATGAWTPLVPDKQFQHELHPAPREFRPSFGKPRECYSSGFVESHVRLSDLDAGYARWRAFDEQHQLLQQQNTQTTAAATSTATRSNSCKKVKPAPNRPIRIVLISDTHQYHGSLRVPNGDILIHAGDILMSDRINIGPISRKYLSDFFTWLNALPHLAITVIAGNHDDIAAQMTKEELQVAAGRAHFLFGDKIIDLFGVRIFGNSFSDGTTPNKAFQNAETLNALANVPVSKVVDGTNNKDDQHQQESAAAGATAAAILPPRSNPLKSVDILVTHGLLPQQHEGIVRNINPVLHCQGHDHGLHGMWHGGQRSREGAASFSSSSSSGSSILGSVAAAATAAISAAVSSASSQPQSPLQRSIPQINGAIVAELHKWNPRLQPCLVFDVIPLRE